jgi:hypothetical protein
VASGESDALVRSVVNVVADVVRRALERQGTGTATTDDPFLTELLRDERFARLTRFERSLRSSLGSAGYEEIARTVAEHAGAEARRGVRLTRQVSAEQRRVIDDLLAAYHSQQEPADWASELETLRRADADVLMSDEATVDLQVVRDGKHLLFFMKTVKPNRDQTREAKRHMLLTWAHQFNTGDPPHLETYFALPYNPFGEGQRYTWPHAWRYFNMHGRPVLIGRAFWDLLGGAGTYELVLRAFGLAREECLELIAKFLDSPQ